ncbi:transcriptional regulator [Pseudarthrobacter sp. P1]|uniref:transcriptional regulator n=1 Tax=Pseudarthrobacter sp. P1 TaxID=3418418 RepID=UPI003CE7B141
MPRSLVLESWERSLVLLSSPDVALPPVVWDNAELAQIRGAHPLAAILPVISKLLVQPSLGTGLLVAVGDEHGRLLWVEGDSGAMRAAEGIGFASGTDWSEGAVGTSAPGTALVLGRSLQISGTEHFSPSVHPWSCTAVPLHDPDSGGILGVVDITGGAEAAAGHTLHLVEAAVAAAEAHLRIQRLERRAEAPRRNRPAGSTPAPAKPLYRDSLQILGRETGLLHVNGREVPLSERHAEILAVLALHPQGLSAEELAAMVYPNEVSTITVRAEMVRLRRILHKHGNTLVPQSRPYRLSAPLVVDAAQVLSYLDRGAHRLALGIYRGQVLPHSDAPALTELRHRTSALLRDAILGDASADVVLAYLALPEAHDDAEAWATALRLLPPRSPRRAAVVAHLEGLA